MNRLIATILLIGHSTAVMSSGVVPFIQNMTLQGPLPNQDSNYEIRVNLDNEKRSVLAFDVIIGGRSVPIDLNKLSGLTDISLHSFDIVIGREMSTTESSLNYGPFSIIYLYFDSSSEQDCDSDLFKTTIVVDTTNFTSSITSSCKEAGDDDI